MENEQNNNNKCACGQPFTVNDVDTCARSNELGEEYSTANFYCDNCRREFEASCWGGWDDGEALEAINEKIALEFEK